MFKTMDWIVHLNTERQNSPINAAYFISKLAIAVAVCTLLLCCAVMHSSKQEELPKNQSKACTMCGSEFHLMAIATSYQPLYV